MLVLVGLLAVLAGVVPAGAAGAVLTFDDLGVAAGGRLTLNTQYSGQGVTFNDVSAVDYSQSPFPAGFAHSGTVGIEQCYGVEFCSVPITASFTTGQQQVKVWVGFAFALPQPLTVRLTAFDAGHASVGSAEVTLPANAVVTPIGTPLEVTVAEATIRSLEVSVPGGYTNALAVDDLEFSAVGPPPPCNATSVPTVELTQPPDGLVVQADEFLLEGSVETGGAPIQSASISASGQGTRNAALYPSVIDADGGHFGPVRYSGLLVPGSNRVVVTATNCLGTGTSRAVEVIWSSGTLEVCRFVGKPNPVVVIEGNTDEWKACLVLALGTPGTTVRLDDRIDMDLSGYYEITIANGVTLTSERPGPPPSVSPGRRIEGVPGAEIGPVISGRTPQDPGPRLYTRTSWKSKPLFEINCDPLTRTSVRLFGFRLQGPHLNIAEGDWNLERGIQVAGCRGVEIANMELSGWSGIAIYVVSGPPDCVLDPGAVWIHDNFIHHNQHVGTNGYGVDVGKGACASIERNVFDFNRHAITASGKAGASYRATYNLVLRGGGVHGKWYNQRTHLFDVHGDKNCPDTPLTKHIWNCGNAGDQFWITYNTFQYTADNAIKLRGTPRKGAYIENNVFAHKSIGAAIALRSRTRVHVGSGPRANTVRADTFGRYGVCDFDGDGTDDLFLPTGVSWWYSSGGRMHWVFLNAASERLGQVALGDFDGDRRCDVFTVHGDEWVISSGGTSPWRSLGTYGVPFEELRFGKFNPGIQTDIFRRAPDGQWYVVSPGSHDWRAVQSSSFPLEALRLGDFTGDGISDVLAVQGGRWSISESATGAWETLNPTLSSPLANVVIADVNGNGTDDVVRLDIAARPSGTSVRYTAEWQVSWEGRSDWTPVTRLALPPGLTQPAAYPFAGRFDGSVGADLMLVDNSRLGRLYSQATGTIVRHNLYLY